MVKQSPVKRFVLDNGITVLHQRNPFSRAFCAGMWTRTGARDEKPGEEGLCHFLEHMLFKGTSRRSAFDISQEIERIGGTLDAFTTKDTMCIYAQVLESHRRLAIDLIGDMVMGSSYAEDFVAVERNVVLEEIGDVEDAPDDLIHELFAAAVFPDHPLGRPILGTKESVAAFSRADLTRLHRRTFRGANIVIAVYGNMTLLRLRRELESSFALRNGRPRPVGVRLDRARPMRQILRRKLHQQHVCIGNRTFSSLEDRRFALMVLNTLLGGGMSSRLFQRIRERDGLAYNVFSYADHSRDTGLMATYMAVKPSNARRAVDEVMREFRAICAGSVTQEELANTREQLKGRILLGLESSTARMMRMARNEIVYGRQIGERELIRSIDSVKLEDIASVANQVLDADTQSIVSLGPSRSLA